KNTIKRLSNKVALITGAGSGIGRATSLRYAKEGAKIIVVDMNIETAEETVKMIKNEINGDAIAIECDISIKDKVKSMVEQAYRQFPRIDILFNNAGIGTLSYGELVNISEITWDKVMNVNLRGNWLVSKFVVKRMKKQDILGELRGKIINNASLLGKVPTSPVGVYSITKAGLIAMTKIFAQELAPHKITVNAICPGFMLTGIFMNDERAINEMIRFWGKPILLERTGTATDVANTMFFLASDDSNYLTGQAISCDGGCTAI
ncbi:MAG: SDR family NAD(P)-dependent oxidoreductase, partial [Promethearchaeota archaeon]